MIDGKEIFGAAIRVVGLLAFGRGLVDLLFVFFFTIGALNESVSSSFPQNNLIYGTVYFFGGLYLIRGAPLLLSWAYPDRETDVTAKEEDANQSIE